MSSLLHTIAASFFLALGFFFKFFPPIGCLIAMYFMFRTTRSVMKIGDDFCDGSKRMIHKYETKVMELEKKLYVIEASNRSQCSSRELILKEIEELKKKVDKLNPKKKTSEKKVVKKKETTK